MGKLLADAVIDASLDKFATCTTQYVCSAEPANQAGIAALTLASVTIDSGDFSKANGDTSGRKVTVAQQTGVSVSANGTATHIVYSDGTTMLVVTTCTSQVLTSGNTVTIPAHKLEIADPT